MKRKSEHKLLILIAALLFVFLINIFARADEKPALLYTPPTISQVENAITWLIENEVYYLRGMNLAYRKELAQGFLDSGTAYDLPVFLLVGMSYRESVFRMNETGPAGELGLMQVGTYGRRKCKCEMDTALNQIWCGACYLRACVEYCGGSLTDGLTAYAAGKCKPKSKRTKRAVNIRLRLWRKLTKLAKEKEI